MLMDELTIKYNVWQTISLMKTSELDRQQPKGNKSFNAFYATP